MNGEELKIKRERENLTKTALAKKLGVTRQTIWNWENGSRIGKAEQIALQKIFEDLAAA